MPIALHPAETPTFDAAALRALAARSGGDAESAIAERLMAVETTLEMAEWQARAGETAGLRRSAISLEALAAELGVDVLRRAAAAVRAQLAAGDAADPTATAACVARLIRLGGATAAGWSLADDGAA